MTDPYVFLWAKPKTILSYCCFLLQRYLFPEAEMLHLCMQTIYHKETIFWAKKPASDVPLSKWSLRCQSK